MITLFLAFAFVQPSYQTENHKKIIEEDGQYINNIISGDISQILADGNNIKEISNCTFKNIATSTINYFIRVTGDTTFINNVVENDVLEKQRPGVMWLNKNGKFSLINCKFVRVVTKSKNGNILTVNQGNPAEVTFQNCQFIDCSTQSGEMLVNFEGTESTISFTDCDFSFSDSSKGCKVFEGLNPKVTFERCQFAKCGLNAVNLNIPPDAQGSATSTFKFNNNNVTTVTDRFIYMASSKASIEMNGNTFNDVSISSENNFIHILHQQTTIALKYNTFSHFTIGGTHELNTGGIALFFQRTSGTSTDFTLTYDYCTFIDVKNQRQNAPYSNGGAIQLGFTNDMKSISLNLTNCVFKENQARFHGGAVAIQTSGAVLIKNCTFENNKANTGSDSSLLLDDKTSGFGGAIYMNPSLSTKSSVTVQECTFKKNIAKAGYGIYIDAQDENIAFSISGNKFLSNYDGKEGYCTNGAIDSELTKISAEQIEKDNQFSTAEHGEGSKILVYVDHLGVPLPDPTATPRPTLPPAPSQIEGTDQAYIDKVITTLSSQIRIQDSSTIKQISGCTFQNVKPSCNYFIRIESTYEPLFFNNVVEYDVADKISPGLMWLNRNGHFALINCRFVRVVTTSSSEDANVLTVNQGNSAEVVFENCEFIDCSTESKEMLINFEGTGSTISFTDCVFSFSDSSKGCKVLDALNPTVTFERCQFTGCGPKAVNLNIPDTSTSTGKFAFTHNIVKKQTNGLIYAVNLKSLPEISYNFIEDVTLDGQYLIYVAHNQKKPKLSYNTFSRITTTAASETFCGGFATSLPTSAESSGTMPTSLTYDNCNFLYIKNLHSKKPYYQGGAVQLGFSTDLIAMETIIQNCFFKGNNAYKHGGAIASQIKSPLKIHNCTFEENKANCGQTSAKLLYNDYTDQKNEGRGGAIYVNPTFGTNSFLTKLTITNCTFIRNIAFDGYAIYIEGEESNCVFEISENIFIDNYNGNDSPSLGGVFVSEILKITPQQINSKNTFENHNEGRDCRPFYYAYHDGSRYPDPTMTPLPTYTPGAAYEEWNDHNEENKKRLFKEEEPDKTQRTLTVDVKTSSFTDMRDENGAAIHLKDCGLVCKSQCTFTNCRSAKEDGSLTGAGGAIYIHNSLDFANNVDIEGLTFNQCSALYGGAIYIYSSSSSNMVKIKKCTFTQNKADEKGLSEDLSGGGAIFLSAVKGVILQCKFSMNEGPGGAIRIYNEFNENSLSLLDNPSSIRVIGCSFVANEKKSSSSIFYIAGKSGSKNVEVTNCQFTGNLPSGVHHIEGLLNVKEAPKMILKSCRFVDVSVDKMMVKNGQFAAVEMKSLSFVSKTKNEKVCFINNVQLVIGVAMIAFAALLILFVRHNSQRDELITDNADTVPDGMV